MNILIFGGTTESRQLIEKIKSLPINIFVSVASDYGESMLLEMKNLKILNNKLDETQMINLFNDIKPNLVVDGTHPYAIEVKSNIFNVCQITKTNLTKLSRIKTQLPKDCIVVENCFEAAKKLSNLGGNILLATGSKDLNAYTNLEIDRVFVRIIPMIQSIEKCLSLGYKNNQIIAMQGPFNEQLNCALFNQFDIKNLVTKDSGIEGGLKEKISAAKKSGVKIIVIKRPKEEIGLSINEVVSNIKGKMESL